MSADYLLQAAISFSRVRFRAFLRRLVSRSTTFREEPSFMDTILIVDDDPSMLRLLSINLSDTYSVVTAKDPEQVLGLAMKHKPAAILLDLMMPKYSGFELCQCLHSLSYTSRTPLFVVTGESSERYKAHCLNLGAREFIEKPVDFDLLRTKLGAELKKERPERRAHVRVSLRVILALKGANWGGGVFNEMTLTENVSAGGFLCNSQLVLPVDSVVEVNIGIGVDRFAGRARVMRLESPRTPWQRYAFQFQESTHEWVFNPA
jgi:CheY-like chemotaxis protein